MFRLNIIKFSIISHFPKCTSKLFFSNSSKCEVSPPKAWYHVRLSPNIKPAKYHLWLHPDLNTGLFSGRVTIHLDISAVQSYIAVHIKGLTITKSKLTLNNEVQSDVILKQCFGYSPNEFWICEPEEDLEPNKYQLFFEFNGKLTDKIVGFYRSKYIDADGEERFIATTKFEPTFARQAFPCFDEPGFKSVFNIELVKPAGNEFIALSNMPQEEEIANQPSLGLSTLQFEPSAPMPTYLACFIVCDFDYLEGVVTQYGFPITVYARREFIHHLTFARDIAVNASEFYCGYFHINYPLPKLDLIAIPDFVSGAMENWGLITFRETRLICDPESTPVSTQLDVALTVAHEISHMWFGNLVTMKWWNDLWLNEGFATFMEYKAIGNKYPLWELDFIFMEQELFPVMKTDATLSSHSIVAKVDNPDQITEIFDGISYSKGASIIRMLEMTVGEREFREGIKEYLENYRFKNAETNDLWFHLRNASNNMDVQTFMDTWTRQMGYPVLNVKVDLKRKEMYITQERFLLDPNAVYDNQSSPFNYKWEVPITYTVSGNTRVVNTAWFRKTDEKVIIPLDDDVKWVKLNFRNQGYYIVNYEDWMWKEFHDSLQANTRSIDAGDRASLIFSAFRLAEAEKLSYKVALLMFDYLNRENHFLPWSIASEELFMLSKKFYGTDTHAPFKKYVRSLIKDSRALTWNVDDRAGYTNKTQQNTILKLGCAVENKICLRQAVTLFKQWLTEPSMKLHPELASMIMYYGIDQTSEKEWDSLWELYLKEKDPQYKLKIMKCLCASKEPKLISRLLENGKNENFVRSQDYLTIISFCSQNPTANPIVWDFVRKEWPYLVGRYTLNDRNLGRIFLAITSLFSTETRLYQLNEFFAKYPEAGAGANARKQSLERVKHNISWRLKHFETISEWFKNAAENFEETDD